MDCGLPTMSQVVADTVRGPLVLDELAVCRTGPGDLATFGVAVWAASAVGSAVFDMVQGD